MTSEAEIKAVRRASGNYDANNVPHGLAFIWKTARDIRWIVTGSNCIALLYYRNAFMLILSIGALCNAGLSKVFKYTILQSRPNGTLKRDPGMPSSHAAGLFFFATYLSMGILQANKSSFWGQQNS
eukprot:Ihof_evm4s382 gene=Ihof_evmTU4s382